MTELITLVPPIEPMEAFPAPFSSREEALEIDAAVEPHAVELRLADGRAVPPDLKTWVAAYWTARALTLVFSSTCRIPRTPVTSAEGSSLRTPGLWNLSEVVEVFIGHNARLSGRYREFEAAPDGRWTALDVQSTSLGIMGSEEVASFFFTQSTMNPTNDLWTAVLEIPWTDLSADGPLGGSWFCNLFRSIPGGDAATLMAWRPTGTGPNCFHAPSRFGELIIHP